MVRRADPLLTIVLCLVALSPVAGIAPIVQSGSARTELEGAWQARSIELDGKPAPADTVTRTRYTFKGKQLLVRGNYATDREDELTFAADPSDTPKYLDLTDVNGYESAGIYEIKDDALTICFSRGERPVECRAGMPRVTRIVFTRIR
jgi:uncharacterized protein (TIGR03067 family)